MTYVCGYLFLRLKDGREFRQINPSQILMILQYMEYGQFYNTNALYFYMCELCNICEVHDALCTGDY